MIETFSRINNSMRKKNKFDRIFLSLLNDDKIRSENKDHTEYYSKRRDLIAKQNEQLEQHRLKSSLAINVIRRKQSLALNTLRKKHQQQLRNLTRRYLS